MFPRGQGGRLSDDCEQWEVNIHNHTCHCITHLSLPWSIGWVALSFFFGWLVVRPPMMTSFPSSSPSPPPPPSSPLPSSSLDAPVTLVSLVTPCEPLHPRHLVIMRVWGCVCVCGGGGGGEGGIQKKFLREMVWDGDKIGQITDWRSAWKEKSGSPTHLFLTSRYMSVGEPD